MIDKWLTLSEIAELLSRTKVRIIQRANKEGWPYRSYAARGGKERRYHLGNLPEDIQTAYAASIQTSLADLQSRLQPGAALEKKVLLANHNARSDYGGTEEALETVNAAKRRVAALRVKLLQSWDDSGLNADQFLLAYNESRIAREVREGLGGKTIGSPATLYTWLGKYQHHGEAGLTPKYKGRGGNGASLDKSAKELIWFYYLHKNKPSIAHVVRRLHEKDHIEVSPHIVYRYIKFAIPKSVKDYFRKGKKYFHDHYESYIDIDYTRYYSMQCVVYDHKTLDFASRVWRDGEWRRARLVLTAITDKRSRMILGWWIDEVPSTLTIIRATRAMVERYGCPDTAQFDNGKDFTSYWFTGNAWNEQHNKLGAAGRKRMSCVIDDLGCASRFTEPYHGQSKHIERAFGFFATEFDKSFESYLGSNTSDRHDESRLYVGGFDGAPARPIGELPTIEETRELFALFAEWFNGKWKHSGQGMDKKTPEEAFEENRKSKRDLPSGFARYVWTRREVKIVQRNGIQHEGGWYYNEAMQAITGQEVELRVSIDDIGKAYIFNLAGEYLYDAVSEFADSGITEENVRNVKRLRKQAKKHLEEYQNTIHRLSKDKKTQLEELRESGGELPEGGEYRYFPAPPIIEDTREVAGGEPLAVIKRRRLRLPTDPD